VQRHAGPARTHRHSNHPHRVLITRLADGARALPNILCLQALGCNGSSRPLGAMEDGVQRRPPASALAAGAPTRKRSTEKCNHRPMERQTRRRGHAPTVNILAPAIISANFIFLNCNILLQLHTRHDAHDRAAGQRVGRAGVPPGAGPLHSPDTVARPGDNSGCLRKSERVGLVVARSNAVKGRGERWRRSAIGGGRRSLPTVACVWVARSSLPGECVDC